MTSGVHVKVCAELFQFVFQNNIWKEYLDLIAESDFQKFTDNMT